LKYIEHKLPEKEKIYLLPISDTHIGDPHFDKGKLERYLEWAKKEPVYLILNGDIFNMAEPYKLADEDVLTPNEQLDLAVEIFEPWKNKILGITEGNHERRLRRKRFDVGWEFAQRLGLSNLYDRDGIMLKITFGEDKHGRPVKYFIYATHGWGSGRMPGSKVNNLSRLSYGIPLCDVYIASHTHFMTGYQDIIVVPNERAHRVEERKRTYVSSGSFLKWGGYAERKGFSPAKLGTVRIRLDGHRRDVHISI